MSKAFLEVKTTKNIKKLKREFGADYSEINLGDGAVQLSGKSDGKYYTFAVSPSAMRYNGENAMFSVVHDEKSNEQKVFVGEREFSIPESDGTIATQEWVEKNAGSSSSGGGVKIYRHAISDGGSPFYVITTRVEPFTSIVELYNNLPNDYANFVHNGFISMYTDMNMGGYMQANNPSNPTEIQYYNIILTGTNLTDTVEEIGFVGGGSTGSSSDGGTKLYKHNITQCLDPNDEGAPIYVHTIVSTGATPITSGMQIAASWKNGDILSFYCGELWSRIVHVEGNNWFGYLGGQISQTTHGGGEGVFVDTVTEL